MVLAAGSYGAWYTFATYYDRQALRLLHSSDPEARRQGAWLAVAEHAPRAIEFIARQLPVEENSAVREAYVYALGRAGGSEYFDLAARVVREDPDRYVGQAAWLAAARLDARRFRELAASAGTPPDFWDQIGLAHAWLEIGDARGVADLLHWAADGTPAQRLVASAALSRTVAPLLDAAGRWPIEFELREGEAWPPALVAEVRERCGTLGLQAILDDTRPHAARAAVVQRNVGSLNRKRDRVARLLFGP